VFTAMSRDVQRILEMRWNASYRLPVFLAVELRGDLPWSITTMPANELKVLFDSRQFHA